jgi:putative FmdB family regulatory protein
MPIYDYRCTQCGREIEVMHGINDGGPSVCASCGGAMRKALSTPAIHFKGSGWAKKDAASASRAKSTGGAADPATASEKGTGGTGKGAGEANASGTGTSAGGGQDAPSRSVDGARKTAASSAGSKDG